eukprot:scaffold4183_cov188-Alexandrium_tamarense.AAC.1
MALMLPSSPSRMAPDRLVATIVDVASTACCERDEGEGRGDVGKRSGGFGCSARKAKGSIRCVTSSWCLTLYNV